MKISVGVDIEEVHRFQTLLHNRRFLSRVYTPQEISYCQSKKNAPQHFAVRFAAKEAVWKALSDVMRSKKYNLGHLDIGVRNDASGKPTVKLSKQFSAYSKKISLSLSHTNSTVVAVAVIHR